ncbi:3-oxo-tetronate kinase [Ancylobacter terrae]|uniref:3-oxo-tetronate kinase n=1 Tax=Ancylobacter sp. sgz301288 TaxID=3342077 RepID=UPI00385812CF
MGPLIGCIADDSTGATDIALTLARGGMRTVQVIGVPDPDAVPRDADAVVVALKSRTSPAAEAVAQSLQSARALRAAGARQIIFKYCSTFDSTDAGNIGPVAEALLAELGGAIATVCPAFPANGRTVYRGHLFVGDRLLSDSPMRDHPLTPMRDADLRRVLARQTGLAIDLVGYETVAAGAAAIRARLEALAQAGVRLAVVDALTDAHLEALAAASADLPLLTGASGIALGLPANFRRQGLLPDRSEEGGFTAHAGRAAILAGSCSARTREQVAAALAAGIPALRLETRELVDGRQTAETVLGWAATQPADRPILVYSSADPAEIAAVQAEFGRERAATLVEDTLAAVARGLVERGVSRLLVAGGETSGAVVAGLGVRALDIGPEIDTGVPWTRVRAGTGASEGLALALKSGNFGAPDFFLKAWSVLS